ncbi:MAG TPA: hypothetical protein VE978_07750 [Chitinophagales bacterium]|nr:hypothetical protein [Chitinophagales bacterium]
MTFIIQFDLGKVKVYRKLNRLNTRPRTPSKTTSMKSQQQSHESQSANTVADSEDQNPQILWQFGEAVEVTEEKKEGIDLTLPILNSTIQRKKTLW